jgi:hypothetical protein
MVKINLKNRIRLGRDKDRILTPHGMGAYLDKAQIVGNVKIDNSVDKVMNDEINGARDVTKTNTYRVEAFRSPELGFLGYVEPDKVSFYKASTKRHTVNSEFDVSTVKAFPKVAIVYS